MSAVQKVEDAAACERFEGRDALYMVHDAAGERLAVTTSQDNTAYEVSVFDVSGAQPARLHAFSPEKTKPRLLTFLSGDRLAYSAYFNARICALGGEVLEEVGVPDAQAARELPSGHVLFHNRNLILWQGGDALREFEDKRAYMCQSVDVTPDERFAVSTGNEPYVRLWDVASGKQLKRVTIGSGGACYAAFSPDGSVVACGGDKDKATGAQHVRLLNVDKKWTPHSAIALPVGPRVYGLGFSADGSRLWVSQHNVGASVGLITLWDWRSGACLHTIQIPSAPGRTYARDVAVSADGKRVFVILPEPDARLVMFEAP